MATAITRNHGCTLQIRNVTTKGTHNSDNTLPTEQMQLESPGTCICKIRLSVAGGYLLDSSAWAIIIIVMPVLSRLARIRGCDYDKHHRR
jgi:hypothetical protein